MMRLRDPDGEERFEAARRAERAREHTPAYRPPPRITSSMITLAHTVLHGSWHDARDASRALAELVLEALG